MSIPLAVDRAFVYPPVYTLPANDGELNAETNIYNFSFTRNTVLGDDMYQGSYPTFIERSVYHTVIHASDADGLQAQPAVMYVDIMPYRVFLPVDVNDTGSELDFVIYQFSSQPRAMADGPLVTVQFAVTCESGNVSISFAETPPVSFADLAEQELSVDLAGSQIEILPPAGTSLLFSIYLPVVSR
ncbi:MAG: hypothetical protein AAF639_20090 [Chloroflexota bacterium]